MSVLGLSSCVMEGRFASATAEARTPTGAVRQWANFYPEYIHVAAK